MHIVFLFDVIGGSAFIALSILFYIPILVYNNASDDMTQPPTSNIVFCNLMTWTLYLGFIYLFTALLCNIYRIKLITDNPLRRGLKILPKHVAGPYFVITTLAFGLLAAWTAIDPTKYELIELGDDPDKVVGSCTLFTLHYYYSANKSFNKWNIIFVSALEALILIVSIILAILSYKIRHVNPELGDSKRIFRLTLYCFINDIVLITITGTSRVWKMDEATKFVFVNTVFILKFILDSVAIIGFIILPRIYYIWYEHKHGHLPERVQMIGRGRVEVHS